MRAALNNDSNQFVKGLVVNATRVEELRQRYAHLSEDDLNTIIVKSVQHPDDLTPEAHAALKSLLAERQIDVARVLLDHASGEQADHRLAHEKFTIARSKSKRRTRVVGNVIGIAGLLIAGVVAIPSVLTGHLGGIVASIATALCSLWFLFRYQGD